MGFLKPTKFKIIFTLFMILIGTYFIWTIFNILWGFQWYGFWDFLNFLFGHFYYTSKMMCGVIGGPPLDTSCFFTRFFITLIGQIVFYYLLASLIGFFYRKAKKI